MHLVVESILFLFLKAIHASSKSIPTATNLTCRGYNPMEYTCTWLPGDSNVVYQATWSDLNYSGQRKWYKCLNSEPSACHFCGFLMFNRLVAVEGSSSLGKSDRVETELDPHYIIPLSPKGLIVNLDDETGYLLAMWNVPEGWEIIKERYGLNYRLRYGPSTSDKRNWIKTPAIEVLEHSIQRLDDFTDYGIQVQAMFIGTDIIGNEEVYGDWSDSVYVTTSEGAPSGVVSLLPVQQRECQDKTNHRDITVSWIKLPKSQCNGILLGYNITLFKLGQHYKTYIVPATDTKITIKCLNRHANYSAFITAYNSAGATKPQRIAIPVPLIGHSNTYRYRYVATVLGIVTLLSLFGIIWRRIKQSEFIKPIPDPHFYKFDMSESVTCRPLCEREIFDDVRPRPDGLESGELLTS